MHELIRLKKELASLKESIKDDVEFAIRTELAYQRHEDGDCIEMDSTEFLKESKKYF